MEQEKFKSEKITKSKDGQERCKRENQNDNMQELSQKKEQEQ